MTDAEQTHVPGVPEQSLPPVVIQAPAEPPLPFSDPLAVEFGHGINDAYKEPGAPPVDAGMISVYSQRCAYDYYVLRMPWYECMTKHLNAFRQSIGVPQIS